MLTGRFASACALWLCVLLLSAPISATASIAGGVTYSTHSMQWQEFPPETAAAEFNSGMGSVLGFRGIA